MFVDNHGKLIKKVKVWFYIALYPVRWTAQSALHFLPWQTCSIQHQLGFSWKHSSHAAIAQRLFTHIPTTVYSQVLIYTAESTEASWRERKCPNFETVAKGIRTRALSVVSLAFYHWATCSTQRRQEEDQIQGGWMLRTECGDIGKENHGWHETMVKNHGWLSRSQMAEQAWENEEIHSMFATRCHPGVGRKLPLCVHTRSGLVLWREY